MEATKGHENVAFRSSLRIRIPLALSLIFLTTALYLFTPGEWFSSEPNFQSAGIIIDETTNNTDVLTYCPLPLPLSAQTTTKNLWEPLTVAELTGVQHWLEDSNRQLNLTRATESQLSDNVIFHIDLYPPPKANVTRYLDEDGDLPSRYARVTIHHGAQETPAIKDYVVGPLPVLKSTTMTPLTEIYHNPEIPFNAHGMTSLSELSDLVTKVTEPYRGIIEELFGTGDMLASISGPFSFSGEWRRAWASWRRNVPGPFLHPLNLFHYIDISGTDSDLWKVTKTVYNHQVFRSPEEMREALRNGTLVRLPHRPDQDPEADLSWTTRNRTLLHGKDRDLDHLPGPRSVSFAGLRFRVDKSKQTISWMGWRMTLGFDRDMGMSLWDIRLKGERLIYQLAPQEAIAQYAGNDPFQSTTAWQDRYFGMGSSVRNLLPHYDCPSESVYLPATSYTSMGTIVRDKAICVFEQDSGRPISRHMGYMKGEFGAIKGYMLTVRSISTVGNYDYIFDYIFHLDGTIEVRVSASGYLQGGYYEPQQGPYGARIRDTSMGSLHDHVINFKVDLDVAGTSNSLLQTRTIQETVTHPWLEEEDGWGTEVTQQKIVKEYIENETDARLLWPDNLQGGYAIVNEDNDNRWGYPRGYAIHPGYNSIHNTVVGSKRLLRSANWAKYNLAISVRHETEPSSSSMWNMNLPGAPTVDFDRFFDNEESTRKTDLVAWVNVGMHHLPQAEDSPNTKTNLATSSFMLTPLNYFDADISMDSRNAILMDVDEVFSESGDTHIDVGFDNYGVDQSTSCIPAKAEPFNYHMVTVYDADGKEEVGTVQGLRRTHELYHGLKAEAEMSLTED